MNNEIVLNIDKLKSFMPKNVVSLKDFSSEAIGALFSLANTLRSQEPKEALHLLQGKMVGTLFYQPSTRTNASFHSAVLRLGASVFGFSDPNTTRAGDYYQESIGDVVKSIGQLCNLLIIRHHETGIAEKVAKFSPVPIINAGDGYNEHPTQGLGDIWTMHQELNGLQGKTIGLVGKLGLRSFHSILIGLGHFQINKILFLPEEGTSVPMNLQNTLNEAGIKWQTVSTLEEMLSKADLIETIGVRHANYHQTYSSPLNDAKTPVKYVINAEKLKKFPKVPILHPGPRIDEIAEDVDVLPQAAYFRQVNNGLWIRMALLLGLLY